MSCLAVLLVVAIAAPISDELDVTGQLGERDSIVIFRVESVKPAKVTILNSVVETTLLGPTPPSRITLSFLHFPECRRMSVGETYLGVIRHGSGDGYSLVRSDMLPSHNGEPLHNYFWAIESEEARNLVEKLAGPAE